MKITAKETLNPNNEIHFKLQLISFFLFLCLLNFNVTILGQTGRALTLCE